MTRDPVVYRDRSPHQWSTLALFDTHRTRMWQGAVSVVVLTGLIVWAALV